MLDAPLLADSRRCGRVGLAAAARAGLRGGAVSDALLTDHPVLRACILRTAIPFVTYAGGICLLWLSIAMGLTDGSLAEACTPLFAVVPIGFCALIAALP